MPRPKGSKNKSKTAVSGAESRLPAGVREQFEELRDLAAGDEQAERHLMKRLIDAALKDQGARERPKTFSETVEEIVGAFRSSPGVLTAVLGRLMEDEACGREIRKAAEIGKPSAAAIVGVEGPIRGAHTIPGNPGGVPGLEPGEVAPASREPGGVSGTATGGRPQVDRDGQNPVPAAPVLERPVDGVGVGGEVGSGPGGFPSGDARGHGNAAAAVEAPQGEEVDEPFEGEGEGGEIDAFA